MACILGVRARATLALPETVVKVVMVPVVRSTLPRSWVTEQTVALGQQVDAYQCALRLFLLPRPPLEGSVKR